MKGYQMWSQPYEHREAFVQSRTRRMPHRPDPGTYAALIAEARRVQKDGMVVTTSGDWDYREIVLNWVLHAHTLQYSHALVIAMDVELYDDLKRRRVPTADNSANLQAWNNTCLQRYIQAVRLERHLAVAALVGAGIDVLHTDATAVFLRDPLPMLLALPPHVDVFFQRDDWPASPVQAMGTAVNPGFVYLRAGAKGEAVVRLLTDAVVRGLIEFYLRWNNIVDQYGFSFVIESSGVRPHTTEYTNQTTLGTIKRWGCMKENEGDGSGCLGVGFLPYDLFPRHGRWPDLASRALVYHMTMGCVQEKSPCFSPGVRPFRGNRQRLDRYDETDFDDMVTTLRGIGAWLVDASPGYVSPF